MLRIAVLLLAASEVHASRPALCIAFLAASRSCTGRVTSLAGGVSASTTRTMGSRRRAIRDSFVMHAFASTELGTVSIWPNRRAVQRVPRRPTCRIVMQPTPATVTVSPTE